MAAGGGKTGSHRVAFSYTGLSNQLCVPVGMTCDSGLDGLVGVVSGIALDEDNLGAGSHLRDTPENLRDVAGLVARRNDHTYPGVVTRVGSLSRSRASNDKVGESRNSKRRDSCEIG